MRGKGLVIFVYKLFWFLYFTLTFINLELSRHPNQLSNLENELYDFKPYLREWESKEIHRNQLKLNLGEMYLVHAL